MAAITDGGVSGPLMQGFGTPQLIITQGYAAGSAPPPPIMSNGEFDYAEKPWAKEPNSFGFDVRIIPK